MNILSLAPCGRDINPSIRQSCFSFRDELKLGRTHLLEVALSIESVLYDLSNFLPPNTTLVPVPRSAPFSANSVWPARAICYEISKIRNDLSISTIIHRIQPVKKNALIRNADERTTVSEHIASLGLYPKELYSNVSSIVFVDDVVTQGRQLMACKLFLQGFEEFSNIEIKGLPIVRSLFPGQGIDLLQTIVPSSGIISHYSSGKTKTTHLPMN